MREFAVSVLVNLRDRLSGGLNGIRQRLEQLRNLGRRLGLDRLGSAFGGVIKQVGLLGAAFTTLATVAGGGLILLGNQLAERGGQIEAMARTAAVTTDALQEMMYVGATRGVEGDALVDALKEMQLRADELIITGEGSAKEAYQRLGLTADAIAAGLEEPDRLLEEILGRLEDFDPGAQIRILDEVFGGSGEQLQRLIGLGVEGIRELRLEAREIGAIITPEQLAIMYEYGTAVKGLTDRYSGLQNMLAEKLLPVLTPLADQLSAWLDAHRPQIIAATEGAVSALAEAIPVAVDGFQRMIDIVGPVATGAGMVIEKLGGIETVAVALGTLFSAKLVAALAAFGVALLTTPIGWFILVVGGAVALIRKECDTFAPYFEQVLGGVRALFEGDVSAILTIIDGLVAIVGQVVIEFGKWIAEVTGLDKAIEGAIEWIRGLGESLARMVDDAASAVQNGFGAMADWLEALWSRVQSHAAAAFDVLKGLFAWTPLGLVIEHWEPILNFFRELPGRAGATIVAGAGALIEAGAALIQALWDGIKAKFEELLVYVREIPGRITDAIGNIDPIGDIRRGLGNWWNGEEGAEATPPSPTVPAPEGPPQRQSSLDTPALAGARQLASARPATSGAAPRPERQEVAFAGELVVRVDGPGRVTSAQSSDPRVDIQPQRGPSLALS